MNAGMEKGVYENNKNVTLNENNDNHMSPPPLPSSPKSINITTTTTNNEKNDNSDNNNDTHMQQSKQLKKFQLYNWKPDLSLSDDINYMDLFLLITRNSLLKQGSMGCIIVTNRNSNDVVQVDKKKEEEVCVVEETVDEEEPAVKKRILRKRNENNDSNSNRESESCNNEENEEIRKHVLFQRLENKIIAASTNESFYKPNDSDIHAEIVALGQCNQNAHTTTTNSTIYITMPPCKRCFCALAKAGIKRIVSRVQFSNIISDVAKREGIELVSLGLKDPLFMKKQTQRIQELVDCYNKQMD